MVDGAPWTTRTLSVVLQRESGRSLGTELNLQTYRQVAIAISRCHLASGGFKLDYGTEQKALDAQAAHDSNVAGSMYARSIQQARGWMESRQAMFRGVSREWHTFLGFCSSLPPRQRGLVEGTRTEEVGEIEKRRARVKRQ